MTAARGARTGGGRPGRPRTLILFGAAAVLVAAALVVLVARAGPEPPAPGPAPEEGAAEDPPADEDSAARDDAERATPREGFHGLVDTVAEQVAAIRGLPVEEPVDAELQDPDELADTIADLAARDRDPEELEIRRRILVSLRLVPADLDLEATLDELLSEQVAGLYSPKDATLYVRTDDPDELSAGEGVTLAHEVLHALQDQHFGLQPFLDLTDEDPDAGLAAQSLIEGDAVLTQELWSLQHQSEEERRARLGELAELDTEVLEQAPRYVRESLLFPYQEGLAFVQTLHEGGGFQAVDAAFEQPPTTSAQILDPDRYLEGEDSVDVHLGGAPGTEWTPLGDYTYGAFDLRSLLRESDPAEAGDVAGRWAGGRVQAWDRDDEMAVSLALAFRDRTAGTRACAALARWYVVAADASETQDAGVYRGDRDWGAVRCSGDRVSVGLGPDAATARTLAGD